MNINRGLVFWGVAFITAGLMALAIQSGLLAGDIATELWRYWPVVLIVIGITIIAARTPFALIATLFAGIVVGGFVGSFFAGIPDGFGLACGGETTNGLTADGSFGRSATVELELNCGELEVGTAAGSDWEVDARYAGDTEPRVTANDGSLRVASEGGSFPFGGSRQDWTVTLPSDVAINLDVDTNAGSGRLDLSSMELTDLDADTNAGSMVLDLSGASVEDLDVSANAGSISITADGSSDITGSLEVNAGSVEMCVPDGASIAITMESENITFSHNLDSRGLERSGDTWRSASGTAAITLAIEGNAASFTLNPDGGCS